MLGAGISHLVTWVLLGAPGLPLWNWVLVSEVLRSDFQLATCAILSAEIELPTSAFKRRGVFGL